MDGALAPVVPRARLRVRGLVQGVGFRPFVHRLAGEFGISGWVRNDEAGVLIEAAGERLALFRAALAERPPPLVRLDALEEEALAPAPPAAPGFAILESARAGAATTAIGPDAAVCGDCLAELFDPADRRHRYPFLNCTHCGPRFTIAARLPYDRPQTSMAGFPLCADCARDYADPADRRFHAQPIACPACGPRLSVPVEEILARLLAGQVLAIKGIGGFHLACDARNAAAVARLRAAKRREAKPFALMAANAASLDAVAAIAPAERALLESPARPIVLLRRRGAIDLPDPAPGLGWVGAMLPYAPLHWLIFHEAAGRPAGIAWCAAPQDLLLVMTSANPPGEPLVLDGAEAARRLHGLADAVVDHDRPILVRADDPVARVVAGAPRWLRRGRGCTPAPIRLARGGPPVAALGAHLKAAVCVTRGEAAFLSQHVGDLDSGATRDFHAEALRHLLALTEAAPALLAHDLHPDLASTALAQALPVPALGVQHHHAHVAAVLAEHGVEGPCLGLALDGHGHGSDGAAWGGELLAVEGARFERLGHLAPLALPGGDAAARQPWRLAAAALHALGRGEAIAARFAGEPQAAGVAALLARGLRCPPSTSCGRLFDAAAGLLGVSAVQCYEGEAAMRLEALVRRPRVLPGGWAVRAGVLDLLPLLAALDGRDPQEGAELFHGTLVAALVDWTLPLLAGRGERRIALGGGCLANAVLAEGLAEGFARHGIAALLPRLAPPGDGGLALGQAWVAQHHLQGEV
ncbi:carbamoyltransferase HypF [Paracraurococcus lichenis]|uniref:Carbamoyltransferase HypF n=1 Tax=Paracraurococcus lichenis TaxID=3064888 RepID=A0ABT9DZJ1_9PROT|nr:carbamoyltransferase HypF [Paracraurococcus sp. LOR1-02]MDO9709321.1 carbamoyltransferase HypF [Paracraurococcus sp. LOR1-02]